MICGALQTLNEEACEDVMEESADVGEFPNDEREHCIKDVRYGLDEEQSKPSSIIFLKKFEETPPQNSPRAKSISDVHNKPFIREDRKLLRKDSSTSIDSQDSSFEYFRPLVGYDPSALYVKNPSPGVGLRPFKQNWEHSTDTIINVISYKDNVVHAETQTPIKDLPKGKFLETHFMKPKSPPDKPPDSGSKNPRFMPPTQPQPPRPPPSDESKNSENSSPGKKQSCNQDTLESLQTVIVPDFQTTRNRKKSVYTLES